MSSRLGSPNGFVLQAKSYGWAGTPSRCRPLSRCAGFIGPGLLRRVARRGDRSSGPARSSPAGGSWRSRGECGKRPTRKLEAWLLFRRSNTAHLKWRECEGRSITASAHHAEDNPRTLRAGRFRRPTEGPQEGRQNGASTQVSAEIKSEKRSFDCVGASISKRNSEGLLIANFRGAWGCPVATCGNCSKCFEILVSAAGFEPATHALKGHCSTT